MNLWNAQSAESPTMLRWLAMNLCYFPIPVVQMHGILATGGRFKAFFYPYLRKCPNLTSLFKWLETPNQLGRPSTFSPWWFLTFYSNWHTFTQTNYTLYLCIWLFHNLHRLFDICLYLFVPMNLSSLYIYPAECHGRYQPLAVTEFSVLRDVSLVVFMFSWKDVVVTRSLRRLRVSSMIWSFTPIFTPISNGWELNLAPQHFKYIIRQWFTRTSLCHSGKAPTSWFKYDMMSNKRCVLLYNTVLCLWFSHLYVLIWLSYIWCWKGCFSQPWQPLRFISRGLAKRSQRHPDIVHEFHCFWDQRCGKRRTSSEFSAFDVSWLDLWPFDFTAGGI